MYWIEPALAPRCGGYYNYSALSWSTGIGTDRIGRQVLVSVLIGDIDVSVELVESTLPQRHWSHWSGHRHVSRKEAFQTAHFVAGPLELRLILG